MIDKIENNITFAIGEMEKEKEIELLKLDIEIKQLNKKLKGIKK